MAPNDGADRRHGDLIRDIGRSSAAAREDDTPESRLMRVADDPLAVREMLSGGQVAGPRPEAAVLLAGEATIRLARKTLVHASHRPNVRLCRIDYQGLDDGLQDSLAPTAFIPSPTDREEALEPLRTGTVQARTTLRASAALAAFCLVALVVWAALRLILH